MRLIDADALQKTLFNDRRVTLFDGTRLGTNAFLIKHETVYNLIEEAPTVDAEPVRHGEWIPIEMEMRFGTLKGVKCSLCGKEKVREGSNYCPNCGARMDGGEE